MEKDFQRSLVEWEKTKSENSMREVLAQLFRHETYQESQQSLIRGVFVRFLCAFLHTLQESMPLKNWKLIWSTFTDSNGEAVVVRCDGQGVMRGTAAFFVLYPDIKYSLRMGEPYFYPVWQGGSMSSYETRVQDRWANKPPELFASRLPVNISELREALEEERNYYEG